MNPFPEKIDGCAGFFLQMRINGADGLGKIQILQDIVKTDHRNSFQGDAGVFHQGNGAPCFHVAEGKQAGNPFLQPSCQLLKQFVGCFRLGLMDILLRDAGFF